MGFSDIHAHMISSGSVLKKGEAADPRMIRYSTGYYPSDVGVELVINDIEDFRVSAEMAEPRLKVLLVELVNNLDLGLASKGSENGRRMLEIQKENETLQRIPLRTGGFDSDIDRANYSQSKAYDGNKHY